MKTIMVGGELVGVPDNATPELMDKIALTHAQSKKNDQLRKEASELPAPIRAMGGFVNTFVEPVMGLAQAGGKALGMDTSSIERRAAELRAEREGYGTAGTVGEVGAFALPGGAGAKAAAKVLPKALGKLAPAVAAGAVEQGAYEAARPTLEGDSSRLSRGATGAAWGAGGASAGALLPRALTAVGGGIKKPTRDALHVTNQFRRAGMESPLTVGQTLGGGAQRFEEALMAAPGSGLPQARERALEAWNTAEMTNAVRDSMAPVLGRDVVTHPGMGVRATDYPAGHGGLRKLNDDIKYLYDAIFNKADPHAQISPNDTAAFSGFSNASKNLAGEQAATAQSAYRRIADRLQGGGIPTTQIKEVESELREMASKAYRDAQYDLGNALDALKADFREVYTRGWTPLSKSWLKQTDELYARTRPIIEAAATQGALTRKGVFTPAQKLSRIRAKARPSQLSSGRVPGQIEAEQANKVLGSRLPEVGPGTAEKMLTSGAVGTAGAVLAGLTSGPGAMAVVGLPMAAGRLMASPKVARAVSGQLDWQRNPAMKAVVKQLMQKYGVSAEVAAAMAARSGENDAS